MNNIVVTGATSMIGIAAIEACLSNDVKKIYAVVRPGSRNLYRLPSDSRISVIECDLSDYGSMDRMIAEPCDVFYHFAWSITGTNRNHDIYGQARNIIGTLEAVSAAARLGCSKFIGAGSQAEYGILDIDRIGIHSPVNPVQPYGIAKYAAGKLAMEEAKKLGISCIWVRIFSVYGKYDKETSMISSALEKMKRGEKVSFTEGIQRWDYLYSEDAGAAFYLIGKKAVGCKVYCLGSGQARLLKDFIILMRDAVNPELPVGLGDVPYKRDTVMNLCADISELQKDTGWIPKVGFVDGISRTIGLPTS